MASGDLEPVGEPTKQFAMVTDRRNDAWIRDGAQWRHAPSHVSYRWGALVTNHGPLTIIFDGVDEGADV
jgi:hypothetical protein